MNETSPNIIPDISPPTAEADALGGRVGEVIAGHFPHLDGMSSDQLMHRREELLDTCLKDGVRDYNAMSDDALNELFYVNRLLRRKNSGPPKKVKSERKTVASLDDLV